MNVALKTEHPHIERRPGVCGGSAVIEGTRIPVRLIIGFLKFGLSAEEILESYSDLRPAQVYDAISYYYDHADEIDRELAESEPTYIEQKHGLRPDSRGFLVPRE